MSIPIVNTDGPTQKERLEAMLRAAMAELSSSLAREVSVSPITMNLICPEGRLDPDALAERVAKYSIGLSERIIGRYSPPTQGLVN